MRVAAAVVGAVVVAAFAAAAAAAQAVDTPLYTAPDQTLAHYLGRNLDATAKTIGAWPSVPVESGAQASSWSALNGSATAAARSARTELWRAAVAARFLPGLSALGTIGLGIGAFEVGWRIGRAIDTHFLGLSASFAEPQLDDTITSMGLFPLASGECEGVGFAAGCYAVVANGGSDPCMGDGRIVNAATASGSWACKSAQAAEYAAVSAYAEGELVNYTAATGQTGAQCSGFAGSGAPTVDCFMRVVSASVVESRFVVDSWEPYDAQDVDKVTSYSIPADAGNAADLDAARAVLDPEVSSAATGWGASAFDAYVDPDGGYAAPATSVALPRPGVNETYDEYLGRLADEGYVGVVTPTVLTEAASDAALGPDAVVAVRTGSDVWRTSGWPDADPVVAVDAPLAISRNAATLAPAPSDSTCAPWVDASLDLTPLSGLDLGGQFPFGLFGWAADVLAMFNVAPEAPDFTFNFEQIDGPGGTIPLDNGGLFDVDLSVYDSYMSTFRSIVSFALWAGAIWYVATGLLGLRLGGNPAEAVDDVIP